MMEQRFSQSGQRALVWAYQAARRLGHGAIGPEHLLLGALQEEDGGLALQVEEVVAQKPAAAPKAMPRSVLVFRETSIPPASSSQQRMHTDQAVKQLSPVYDISA